MSYDFNADDVIFSFNQWLDPNVGSPMAAVMCPYLDTTGIEKVNRYQVRLHLNRPEIAVPEHLFYYPAVILNHRTFEGSFLRSEERRVGKECRSRRSPYH